MNHSAKSLRNPRFFLMIALLMSRTAWADLRVPAEFEPVQAVVIGWREPLSILKDISRALAEDSSVSVIAADGPRQLADLPRDRYEPVDCPLNTIWIRDYGPIGIHSDTGQVAFVDAVYRHFSSRRSDDRLPVCLAQKLDFPAVKTDLILDGGNFMTDSAGNLFMTNRTYSWNDRLPRAEVDERLKKIYGAQKIHVLEYAGSPRAPLDGTGHIDMFVKLLSPDTVLISEAETEPFRSVFDAAAEYFRKIKTSDGRDYNVLRIGGWFSNGTWYTYTNSLLVNGLALVPEYSGETEKNDQARAVYESAGFKVRMIPSDKSIVRGGSIHCVTQTVPSR
jgi:agmatine deiminase